MGRGFTSLAAVFWGLRHSHNKPPQGGSASSWRGRATRPARSLAIIEIVPTAINEVRWQGQNVSPAKLVPP